MPRITMAQHAELKTKNLQLEETIKSLMKDISYRDGLIVSLQDDFDAAIRKVTAYKGQVTRLKRRVAELEGKS